MNLESTAIENVDKVTAVIDLDQNSKWELAHMELAQGFSATYSIDAETNDATITITRTGNVTGAGNAVLASMPIRVWSPVFHHDGSSGNEDASSYRLVSVISHVEKGVLNETNGTTSTFGSLEQETTTEWNSTRLTSTVDKTSYHIHTAEAIEDVTATCTTNGYTGRTFCEGCNSVVAWGTTISATGHSYDFDENGVLKCTCGELFNGIYTDGIEYVNGVALDGWVGESYYVNGVKLTGVQKVEDYYYNFGEDGVCENKSKYSGLFFDGELYRYAYLGVLTSGWQMIDNEWYYFSASTMAAANGHVKVGGVYFDFEENGKLVSGVWAETFDGVRYYYGPSYHKKEWQLIDGNWYYFKDGYRLTGYHRVKVQGDVQNWKWHHFAEDGILQGIANGLCVDSNGDLRYIVEGTSMTGLRLVEGDYYFFLATGEAIRGETYYAYETNCDLPKDTYTFGEDGKAINGIVELDDGFYYYVNGRAGKEYGLVEVDGNYYFALQNGKLIANQSYYAWATNCDLPTGTYYFDAEGKLANGVMETADGYYYFVDGKADSVYGLFEYDGDYFFALKNGKLITRQVYYAFKTNCDLPVDNYEFGADGKMLQGIVEKDGSYYYYTNGKTGAVYGLFEYEGEYYFALMNGQLITSQFYYAWKTVCDLSVGNYEFGADGKVLSGIIELADGYYYYTNGKAGREYGLVNINGDYYFVMMDGKIITDQSYYAWKTVCDLPADTYEFGTDGKMLQGIVEKDDGYYYYVNGKAGRVYGLFLLDGYYYFAQMNGKLITDCRYHVWEGNGLLIEMTYTFDEFGRIVG